MSVVGSWLGWLVYPVCVRVFTIHFYFYFYFYRMTGYWLLVVWCYYWVYGWMRGEHIFDPRLPLWWKNWLKVSSNTRNIKRILALYTSNGRFRAMWVSSYSYWMELCVGTQAGWMIQLYKTGLIDRTREGELVIKMGGLSLGLFGLGGLCGIGRMGGWWKWYVEFCWFLL